MTDLAMLCTVPVKCPRCGKDNIFVAGVVSISDDVQCHNHECGKRIDLTSPDWLAFRTALTRAFKGLEPLFAKLP